MSKRELRQKLDRLRVKKQRLDRRINLLVAKLHRKMV